MGMVVWRMKMPFLKSKQVEVYLSLYVLFYGTILHASSG